MNVDEICKLLETASRGHVIHLIYENLDVTFHIGSLPMEKEVNGSSLSDVSQKIPWQETPLPKDPYAFAAKELKLEDVLRPPSILGELSQEEILFAATPYFDEIQQKKADHQKKLNDELELRKNA
jgi:hypothetical protein